MNKGIELLLERRKTNPEEFVSHLDRFEYSRWGRLFRNFGNIDLNKPSTYPSGYTGEEFTRQVMDRLLTQSDLVERKSGVLSRAQLVKELLPGLNELFGKEYAEYGEALK